MVEAGGQRQVAQRIGGGSYQSSGDLGSISVLVLRRELNGWKCDGHQGRSTGTMDWTVIVVTCSAREPPR